MDLLLVSCRVLPEPDPDAEPLAAALAGAGIAAKVAAWDDPDVDWAQAPFALLRSCWNYPQQPDAFRRWLARTSTQTTVINPAPVVAWNFHKRYLLDLERWGLPVTPTVVVESGQPADLSAIRGDRDWTDVVIKPAISGGSYMTRRFAGAGEADAGQAHLDALLDSGDALVQPFVPSVEDYGERAIIVIDGQVQHAVRKSPRFDGDDESVSKADIRAEEADLARRTVAAIPGEVLYARVDIAPGPDGAPRLMELELIEPSLFFTQGPQALAALLNGLRRALAR